MNDEIKDIVYTYEKTIVKDDNTINVSFDDKQETITLSANSYQIVKNALKDGSNVFFNDDGKTITIRSREVVGGKGVFVSQGDTANEVDINVDGTTIQINNKNQLTIVSPKFYLKDITPSFNIKKSTTAGTYEYTWPTDLEDDEVVEFCINNLKKQSTTAMIRTTKKILSSFKNIPMMMDILPTDLKAKSTDWYSVKINNERFTTCDNNGPIDCGEPNKDFQIAIFKYSNEKE